MKMDFVQSVWKKVTSRSYSLMEKHFATDETSWGSNPYGTSNCEIAHLVRVQDS